VRCVFATLQRVSIQSRIVLITIGSFWVIFSSQIANRALNYENVAWCSSFKTLPKSINPNLKFWDLSFIRCPDTLRMILKRWRDDGFEKQDRVYDWNWVCANLRETYTLDLMNCTWQMQISSLQEGAVARLVGEKLGSVGAMCVLQPASFSIHQWYTFPYSYPSWLCPIVNRGVVDLPKLPVNPGQNWIHQLRHEMRFSNTVIPSLMISIPPYLTLLLCFPSPGKKTSAWLGRKHYVGRIHIFAMLLLWAELTPIQAIFDAGTPPIVFTLWFLPQLWLLAALSRKYLSCKAVKLAVLCFRWLAKKYASRKSFRRYFSCCVPYSQIFSLAFMRHQGGKQTTAQALHAGRRSNACYALGSHDQPETRYESNA